MGPLDVQRDLGADAPWAWPWLKSRLLLGLFEAESGLPSVVEEVQAGGIGQAERLVEYRQGAGTVVAVPGGGDEGGVVELFEDADGLAGAVPLDAAEGDVVVIGFSRY